MILDELTRRSACVKFALHGWNSNQICCMYSDTNQLFAPIRQVSNVKLFMKRGPDHFISSSLTYRLASNFSRQKKSENEDTWILIDITIRYSYQFTMDGSLGLQANTSHELTGVTGQGSSCQRCVWTQNNCKKKLTIRSGNIGISILSATIEWKYRYFQYNIDIDRKPKWYLLRFQRSNFTKLN